MLRTLGNRAAAIGLAAASGLALALGTPAAALATGGDVTPADGESNGGAALGAILFGFVVVVLLGVTVVKLFGRKHTHRDDDRG